MSDATRAAQTTGKLALVFPGQGSQHVGMARDVCERYPAAKRVLNEADAVLDFSLSQLCFEGPESELTDTINAQPAILAVSAALLAIVQERLGAELTPALLAGHSLGEYTALWAAGAFDFPTALRLVRERGRAMKAAGELQPGAMAAVLGMPVATLQTICAQVGDVWVANDNSPGQVVLSGKKSALEQALRLAKEHGAKRVIPLAVSIASHSPLMAPAADTYASTLEQHKLTSAHIPVVANVSALPMREPAEIRMELLCQFTSPVRWVDTVHYMVAQGVQIFLEIGPKNALTRLIQQIDPGVRVLSSGSLADLEALEAYLG